MYREYVCQTNKNPSHKHKWYTIDKHGNKILNASIYLIPYNVILSLILAKQLKTVTNEQK